MGFRRPIRIATFRSLPPPRLAIIPRLDEVKEPYTRISRLKVVFRARVGLTTSGHGCRNLRCQDLPELFATISLDKHSGLTVSVRLSSDLPPDLLIRCVLVAEEAGIDRCWFADNPYERSALITAAAVSNLTTRIGLGIGTVSARTRNPVMLAQDVNTVAGYCPGRLSVGLGLGQESERAALGLPKTSGLKILESTTGMLRTLLAGESVNLGEQSTARVRLRTDTHPVRIMFGAVGPKTLDLAARLADGVILSLGASLAYVADAVSILSSANGTSGAHPFEVVAYVFYGGAEDRAVANNLVMPLMARYARAAITDRHIEVLFKGTELSNEIVDELSHRVVEGQPFNNVVSDMMIDDFSIWGDPSRCVGVLHRYRSIGVTEVAFGVGSWLPSPVQAIHEIGKVAHAWRASNGETPSVATTYT